MAFAVFSLRTDTLYHDVVAFGSQRFFSIPGQRFKIPYLGWPKLRFSWPHMLAADSKLLKTIDKNNPIKRDGPSLDKKVTAY